MASHALGFRQLSVNCRVHVYTCVVCFPPTKCLVLGGFAHYVMVGFEVCSYAIAWLHKQPEGCTGVATQHPDLCLFRSPLSQSYQ